MQDYQSLSHTKWDCKYHVVFIPKKRKKLIFGAIRKHLGEVLHELAGQKECRILEVYQHSTEILGGKRGGLHQGEERDLDCASVQWAEPELRG